MMIFRVRCFNILLSGSGGQILEAKAPCPSLLMRIIKRTEIVKNFIKYPCAAHNVTLHICAGKKDKSLDARVCCPRRDWVSQRLFRRKQLTVRAKAQRLPELERMETRAGCRG